MKLPGRVAVLLAAWFALPGAGPREWPVINEDGKRLRFGSDVILGQVTVVHFMFTSCQSFCPLSGSVMSRAQAKLASSDRPIDYRIVSISIRPSGTTPSKLKAWLRQYGAGNRWTALHVEQPALGQIMRFYGETETDILLHSSQMIVLNERGAITQRFDRLPTPEQLASSIRRAGRL